jgi:hypothetical protein
MTDHPFAAEAETVKRATGLTGAIAADLSLFGGILRCEECGGERPLDDVAGYLSRGWPVHCGRTMTWVTLKLLAAEAREVPDGYELVAVTDSRWRLDSGKTCVRRGEGRRTCGEPSVAAFNRQHTRTYGWQGTRTVDSWWGYCLAHVADYGNWVEGGKVMHWILRESEGGTS